MGGTTVSSETYTYDTRSRMETVTSAQGTTVYAYNLDNTRSMEHTKDSSGNILYLTSYSYAATGILSMIDSLTINNVRLARYHYTYYMDGNVYTETDTLANTTTTYTYDLAGRLKTEVSPAGTYSYTYDAAGNRATMTENGTTTTYTYDKNNRLLTETKAGSVKTYTYDANGNMLTGDGATYTYDARNRQYGFVKSTNSATYTYYPTGLRKTRSTKLSTTNFIWDGSNMICEYATSASAGKVYVYGLTLISQKNSLYYIYNAHGDVVKYINSSGTILKSYDYDAFGKEVNASTSDANPFRYAGQYYDTENGTYYLRARYYSPALGRFTQQDAWGYGDPGDPLSLNLYVYCYNDPVRYCDPSGHWILELIAITIGMMALSGLMALSGCTAQSDEVNAQIDYDIALEELNKALIHPFDKPFDTMDEAAIFAAEYMYHEMEHEEIFDSYEYMVNISRNKNTGKYYVSKPYRNSSFMGNGEEHTVDYQPGRSIQSYNKVTGLPEFEDVAILHTHPWESTLENIFSRDRLSEGVAHLEKYVMEPTGRLTRYISQQIPPDILLEKLP